MYSQAFIRQLLSPLLEVARPEGLHRLDATTALAVLAKDAGAEVARASSAPRRSSIRPRSTPRIRRRGPGQGSGVE